VIRVIKFFGVLTLFFGAVACSGLLDSDEPAERVYWLEALVVQQAVANDGSLPSLAVSVRAAPGLDTDRLLILGPGAELNHYSAASWPDNIPEVLESLLRTTLESTGRYSRVTGGSDSRSTGQELELEIREFYTRAIKSENAQIVRVALRGYVSCAASDHVIVLEAAADIDDNRLSRIVAAYQHALHEVSRQLVTQLGNTCMA
jgi:ABC-type uncharacterized transport system auxiliary subunit